MASRQAFGIVLLIVCALVKSGLAFVSPLDGQRLQRCSNNNNRGVQMIAGQRQQTKFCRQETILFSTPSEDEPTSTETTAPAKEEPVETQMSAASSTVSTDEPEGTDYPLDVPSPILLAAAMILAIVSTGSVFQLTSGTTPPLGFLATSVIAVVGAPSCIFLLYAAILKGTAETEEDDARFLSGK